MQWWWQLREVLGPGGVKVVQAIAIVLVGLAVSWTLRSTLRRALARRASAQFLMLAQRLVSYLVLGLTVVMVLRYLGVDLGVLLGAAGVLTVALGFASQTTASNLISGLFLMAEQSFVVGDSIQVGQTTGEVLSIDMLSVKIRTFDNLYVRLPNETLLKSEITNLTRHPIRRVDIPLFVAYETSLEEVRALLLQVARDEPRCLESPKAQVAFLGFGESAMQLRFSLWTATDNVMELRTDMPEAVQRALREHDITPPYPTRRVLVMPPHEEPAAETLTGSTE